MAFFDKLLKREWDTRTCRAIATSAAVAAAVLVVVAVSLFVAQAGEVDASPSRDGGDAHRKQADEGWPKTAAPTASPIADLDTLQFVVAIFRHAERTPYAPFPKDEHLEHWKRLGFGQISERGVRHQFELGKWLRNRYGTFVAPQYQPTEVWVRSTDVDRNIVSAQVMMAGFYHTMSTDLYGHEVPWQPVPVHTVAKKVDRLMIMESYCPRYFQLLHQNQNSPEMVAFRRDNAQLRSFLEENTGINITEVVDYLSVHDTLHVEEINGLPLPAWSKNVYPDILEEMVRAYYTHPFFTHDLRRLRGGPLVGEIVKSFGRKVGGKSQSGAMSHGVERKMNFYMGHDNTLAALLLALGIYEPKDQKIGFSFHVIAELHRHNESYGGEYFIKLFKRGGATDDWPLEPVAIPGCNYTCPWAAFASLTSPMVPADLGKECSDEPGYCPQLKTWLPPAAKQDPREAIDNLYNEHAV